MSDGGFQSGSQCICMYVCSMELQVYMANLKANRRHHSVCCRSEEGH